MDYFHRDGDSVPDFNLGYRVRETGATANYPGGARRIRGAFRGHIEDPIVTDVLYASPFEGQQHPSGHYRHEHGVPGKSGDVTQIRSKHRQEQKADAEGTQKEDVKGRILDDGLYN